jgi:hypothetical protein
MQNAKCRMQNEGEEAVGRLSRFWFDFEGSFAEG